MALGDGRLALGAGRLALGAHACVLAASLVCWCARARADVRPRARMCDASANTGAGADQQGRKNTSDQHGQKNTWTSKGKQKSALPNIEGSETCVK